MGENNIHVVCKDLIAHVSWLFILPCVLIFITACLTGLIQTRFKVSLESVKPQFEKVSPLKGLKRIFSSKSLFDFFKNLMKFIIIISITYVIMKPYVWTFIRYPELDLHIQLKKFLSLLLKILTSLIITIFIIAIMDYFYERWTHLKNLRMTKQEVKDERKEMEGDPQIKGRIRQIRLERARRRLTAEIPKATVIITNPTHFAVALKYTWGEQNAPVVVAKGVDFLAKIIKDTAKDHGIPIVENAPLARALYKDVKEGKEIPLDFYDAVAKIIRYVYDLKKKY